MEASSLGENNIIIGLLCTTIVLFLTTVYLLLPPQGSRSTIFPPFIPLDRRSHDVLSTAPAAKLICFRVFNIPRSWTRDDLLAWVQKLDEAWNRDGCSLALYPSCFGEDQTAVIGMERYPIPFQDIKADHPKHFHLSGHEKIMLSVDIDFCDLTPLNSPVGNIVADVVAVTGLAGHAFGSWRNSISKQMWLQDLLPQDVGGGVRIMTYGYHRSLSHSTDNSSLLDFTRGFAQQLAIARDSPEAKARPLIFIGHSLGATLILQLLIHSRDTPSKRSILDSTRAIFFFGAAHQGLRTEELEAMVMDLSEGAENAQLRLLRQLRENSEFLQRQRQDLVYLWDGLKIFSFYETELTETVKKSAAGKYARTGEPEEMVKNFSAQLYLRDEERIPVRGNHTQLVKFASRSDPAYQAFLIHLKMCLSELNARNDPDEKYRELLEALHPPEYDLFRQGISKPADGTLKWFLYEPLFTSWLNSEESTLFSICGSPGQGKTVMSKFILDHLDETAAGSDTAVLYFFFYDRDRNRDMYSLNSLLRSLVSQLVRSPGVKRFRCIPSTAEACTRTARSNETMWKLFSSMVREMHAGKVYILIDGLDECEKGSEDGVAQELLHKLRILLSDCGTLCLKVIVTTRPLHSILDELECYSCFDLKAHAEDLKFFIDQKVSALPRRFTTRFRNTIKELLLEKAGSTFLWVSIMAKRLESLKIPSIDRIEKTVGESSTDLNSLYEGIFNDIFRDSEEEQKLVLWVAYARRQLTLEELNAAISTQLNSTNHLSTLRYSLELSPDSLTPAVGIVLEIHNGVVRLIHQSAKDFIEDRKYFSNIPWCAGGLPDAFIATICIRCLAFDEISMSYSDGLDIVEAKRQFPLLDYASRNWYAHVREFDEIRPVADQLFQIIEPGSPKRQVWGDIAGILSDDTPTDPLMLAVKLNFEWLACYILSEKCQRLSISQDALRYALTSGSPAIVRGALKTSGHENSSQAIEWVAGNLHAGKESILASMSNHFIVTKETVERAAANWAKGDELMEGLVGDKNAAFDNSAVEAVARLFSERKLRSVLQKRPGSHGTKVLLMAASKNIRYGASVMKEILQLPGIIEVDSDIIKSALENKACGKEIIATFFGVQKIRFTEEAIAHSICFVSGEMLELLFGPEYHMISSDIVLRVIQEKDGPYASSNIQMLPASIVGEVPESVLEMVARLKHSQWMQLLLSRHPKIEIAKSVLVAAAGNRFGAETMELLLSHDPNLEITEIILEAAAGNFIWGKQIIKLLLSQNPSIEITETILVAAVVSYSSGSPYPATTHRDFQQGWARGNVDDHKYAAGVEVIELLITHSPNIEITEMVLVAATGNYICGQQIIELLLDSSPSIEITEKILVAAARTRTEIVKLLLDHTPNIEITEMVLVAAAGNYGYGKQTIELLLKHNPNIEITETILMAAVRNEVELIELLLTHNPNIEITEKILVTAAEIIHGADIMEHLLTHNPKIEITEAILVAAAENSFFEEETMKLLLRHSANAEITEAVLSEVVRNGHYGEGIITMLLKKNSNLEITEVTLVAAASINNEEIGLELVKLLLAKNPKIRITRAVLEAAENSQRIQSSQMILCAAEARAFWKAERAKIETRRSGEPEISTADVVPNNQLQVS